MASSPLTSHAIAGETSLDDDLGITRPQTAAVSPADVKSAKELDFGAIGIVALFKKRNYTVHTYVGITSNILLPSVSVSIQDLGQT